MPKRAWMLISRVSGEHTGVMIDSAEPDAFTRAVDLADKQGMWAVLVEWREPTEQWESVRDPNALRVELVTVDGARHETAYGATPFGRDSWMLTAILQRVVTPGAWIEVSA